MKLVLKGPWRKLRKALDAYPKRLEHVRVRTAYDLAAAFKEKLLEFAPKGDEYEKYLESLEVVQLTGLRGIAAFAVVSMSMKERIGDVLERDSERDRALVYVEAGAAAMPGNGIELLEEANPWPIFMLPSGIPRGDVRLLHRQVTEGEMEWAKRSVRDFVKAHEGEFRSVGFTFGKVEDPDMAVEGMESTPDYMTLALRAELGVNAEQVPHWRPALRWVRKNTMKILEGDDEIKRALQDPEFRKHTFDQSPSGEDMDARKFGKQTEKFRSMVRSA